MPRWTEEHSMSPDDRRREVAAILARGVLRLRRIARIRRNVPVPESRDLSEKGLELPGETRLSASDGTRGLRQRDDGDNV